MTDHHAPSFPHKRENLLLNFVRDSTTKYVVLTVFEGERILELFHRIDEVVHTYKLIFLNLEKKFQIF